MIPLSYTLLASLAATFCIAGADTVSEIAPTKFNQDRAAIRAMEGDFRATFRFDETLTIDPESKPSKRHVSRAHETARIIEDRGDFISLQHLLVSEDSEGKQFVVKHWRQDWAYQPTSMVIFRGNEIWENIPIDAQAREYAWSETVYQVDDSPGYSGLGYWRHIGDHSYWEATETWRPLPRREQKVRDDYDVLVGTNRDILTPEGWAHEQSNYKLALRDGGPRVLARETGLNTYVRVEDYDFTVANDYWASTAAFWKAVRAHWNDLQSNNESMHIAQEIDGKKLYEHIMPIAKKFANGDYTSVAEATDAYIAELARYFEHTNLAAAD